MPTIYKKKPPGKVTHPRNDIPLDILKRAYNEVMNKTKSVRQAANDYGIPKSTLFRYIQKRKLPESLDYASKHVSRQLFTQEEERLLSQYLTTAADMLYGLNTKQTLDLAYEYAVRNNKDISDAWRKNKSASKDWLRGFLHRQGNLSIRKPEATSLSRATSFNRKNVHDFFDNLKTVLDRYNFSPARIYNTDETGLQTVQQPGKIIAQKGRKQVGKAVSAEKGQTVTACCTINAIGNTVPPFFIFPRVRFKDYMLKNAPVGSVGSANPSGWMTGPIFIEFLKHFYKYAQPSKEAPVLLLYDNHETHISIDIINFAREKGIVILTIPPHCSHKLQPLDVGVYSSFKKYVGYEHEKWLVNNPGKTITIYEIAEFVRNAYSPSFTQQNIESGFRKTGICPYNRDIFTDVDFLPSAITDRPIPEDNDVANADNQDLQLIHDEPQPGCSGMVESPKIVNPAGSDQEAERLIPDDAVDNTSQSTTNKEDVADVQGRPGATFVSPEMGKPLPLAQPRKKKRVGRKPGRTRILTDTPEKLIIEEEIRAKEEKLKKKEEKAQLRKDKKLMKVTKPLFVERLKSSKSQDYDLTTSSEEEENEVENIYEESDQSPSDSGSDSESEDRNFEEKDFVIVKFVTENKGEIFYIGQVTKNINDSCCEVKFLRRRGTSMIFSWPEVEDIQQITYIDIVKKAKTSTAVSKKRMRNCVMFNNKSLCFIKNLR